MGEPEEVILQGAHRATTWAAAVWRRNRVERRPSLPELADLRKRLELYVGALFPAAPPLVVAEPPVVPGLATRWLRQIPAHLVERAASASTDGARIRLPRSLACETAEATLDLYRLLALEQAIRATRETPDHLPSEPLLRDLYLLSEAAAVDAHLVRELPGLRMTLARARASAAASRPDPRVLTEPERILARWQQAVLQAPADAPPKPLVLAVTPADSLRWVRLRRPEIPPGRYRGLPSVLPWGRVDPRPASPPPVADAQAAAGASPERTRALDRRPREREAPDDEDDEGPGMTMVPTQDRDEKAEDPMGLSRPLDRDDDADLDELAESLAELPEARLVRTSSPPREVLSSEDPPERRAVFTASTRRTGITYPEWDHRLGGYRTDHVTVWIAPAAQASDERAQALAKRNAPLVAAVRRRFERMQPRRVRRGRQTDGPEVDLDAFVAAFATLRAGGPVEDRLYAVHRPLRRELAISLLVDVSASTDSWVAADRRIIDVERDALLVVAEALDALGDRYAVLAFSGQGPGGVSVTHLKDYPEPYDAAVRRRIASLEPQHFTRLGAAIRHATAGLTREAVRHRLLLVLSDGKPNDLDEYEGRYGVEDARQAVTEARLQHIHPFCLTVDRQAPAYMPRIFGPLGFATLREAATLPRVLVEVIRRLIVE